MWPFRPARRPRRAEDPASVYHRVISRWSRLVVRAVTIPRVLADPEYVAPPANTLRPSIIQGGMGVAISGWELARAVSMTGQLGVVSGTALEVVCARRLQIGDEGGHVRRALAAFPDPAVAGWILDAYFVDGGKPPGASFAAVPRWTLDPSHRLQQLTVAANFVEVFLAKEGHAGVVGVNYLRKIELPLPFACYGAMLAGVDYVLMGAGNPADLPGLLRRLGGHERVDWPVRVQGSTTADGDHAVVMRPARPVSPPAAGRCGCRRRWRSSPRSTSRPAWRGTTRAGPTASWSRARVPGATTRRRVVLAAPTRPASRCTTAATWSTSRRSSRSGCRSGWPAPTAPPRAWRGRRPTAPRACRWGPRSRCATSRGLPPT